MACECCPWICWHLMTEIDLIDLPRLNALPSGRSMDLFYSCQLLQVDISPLRQVRCG